MIVCPFCGTLYQVELGCCPNCEIAAMRNIEELDKRLPEKRIFRSMDEFLKWLEEDMP